MYDNLKGDERTKEHRETNLFHSAYRDHRPTNNELIIEQGWINQCEEEGKIPIYKVNKQRTMTSGKQKGIHVTLPLHERAYPQQYLTLTSCHKRHQLNLPHKIDRCIPVTCLPSVTI